MFRQTLLHVINRDVCAGWLSNLIIDRRKSLSLLQTPTPSISQIITRFFCLLLWSGWSYIPRYPESRFGSYRFLTTVTTVNTHAQTRPDIYRTHSRAARFFLLEVQFVNWRSTFLFLHSLFFYGFGVFVFSTIPYRSYVDYLN
jgi:hypothetical protein